ncbi:MAG: hypothetical protein ACKO0W_09635, partial [Planctomycetota bacterium]
MSLDWRKFSDEPWLRVGEGSSAREADRSRPAAPTGGRGRGQVVLSIIAPLLMCAAYLALSGRPDVQARPATESVREGDAMNMMAASSAMAALAISTMGSAQNLLTNGGFEQGSIVDLCSWDVVMAGDVGLEGWQVTNASIDRARITPACGAGVVHVTAVDGEYFVDLDGHIHGGLIRQEVTLI